MPSTRKRSSRSKDHTPVHTDVLVTVGDWLRFAVTAFSRADISFAQGLHGPQEEALFMVSRFIGIEPGDMPQFLGARLTPDEIDAVREMIRRRIDEHVPTAYLVREAWLGGLRFFVDERVLIPRSYIAELLPEAITDLAGPDWTPARILEIGTGSGALAILAAREFPDARIDAIDISSEALQVAAENVLLHGLDDRVTLLQSDLFSSVSANDYDLIIANPPYEPLDVVESMPPELAHEPRLALLGGDDGMQFVRQIVAESPRYLSPRGVLVLELGGLRKQLEIEYPETHSHLFTLSDGSDAVLGFKAAGLTTR